LAPPSVATRARHGSTEALRLGGRPGDARTCPSERDPGVRRARSGFGGKGSGRDRLTFRSPKTAPRGTTPKCAGAGAAERGGRMMEGRKEATSEDVMRRLATLPPSERAKLVAALGQDRQFVAELLEASGHAAELRQLRQQQEVDRLN